MSDFSDLIDSLDKGQVTKEIDELLEMVIDGVNTHGVNGEITVKLTVKKEGSRAIVIPDVKAKPPREPLGASLMYFDGEKLRRENPLQGHLDLREKKEPVVK